MVLSIIFLEDKHNILLHLSIFYGYQQLFQHRICFSIQPQLHTWFCLSYFLKTNIKFYCIYQYFMSINSFFNAVSVSRYSRPITVTRDSDQLVPAVFFLIMLFNHSLTYITIIAFSIGHTHMTQLCFNGYCQILIYSKYFFSFWGSLTYVMSVHVSDC